MHTSVIIVYIDVHTFIHTHTHTLTMEYAKGNHGPVCAAGTDIAIKPRCYLCNEKVYVKEQYKRKRNGIEHSVRRHFCHYSKSTSCTGSVETAQHLAAKDAVLQGAGPFYFACKCGTHVPIVIEGTRCLEVPWRESTWPIEKQSRRLDVGIVYKDTDIIVGAIEIAQTHFMEQEKIDELTQGGLAWCEVTAENVLSSSGGGLPIPVSRCAVPMCDTCLEREKIEAQTKTELKATMAAREKLKQQIEKDAFQEKLDALFKKMMDEQNAAYHKAIDEKIAPFKFSEEIVVSIHEEFMMHHKFTGGYHEFTYENLVALTGFVPDQAAIEKVESKWARMIEKLKYSASSQEYAQQKLNQQVLAAVKGNHPLEETARHLLEAEPEDVLTIGKYKGMTLEQIFNRDPDYVRTLAMYTGQRDGNINKPETQHNTWSGAYKIRAREFLQGLCLVCYDKLDEEWKSWCPSCYRNMIYGD